MCFLPALVSRWISSVFLLSAFEPSDQHYHDHFVRHATLYIAHLVRQVTHSHKTFQRHSERHLWATSGKTSLMTCDRSKRLQIIRDVLPDGCRSSETSYRCLDRSGAQTQNIPASLGEASLGNQWQDVSDDLRQFQTVADHQRRLAGRL